MAGDEGYIRLASDGSGKKLETKKIADSVGGEVHRQTAELGGSTEVMLNELLEISRAQLAVLRAILASIQGPVIVEEDEFTNQK